MGTGAGGGCGDNDSCCWQRSQSWGRFQCWSPKSLISQPRARGGEAQLPLPPVGGRAALAAQEAGAPRGRMLRREEKLRQRS